MTDIVERLRKPLFGTHNVLHLEAANEIERLRRDCAVDVSELYREIERLRAALQWMARAALTSERGNP